MKTRILSAIFILLCVGTLHAQLRKLPSIVTDSFANSYPHAEKVEWSDRLTGFEASFKLNGVELKAGFSNQGEWKSSEKKIAFEDLPAEVKDGFAKSEFADWKKGPVTELQGEGKEMQYKVYAEKSSPFQKKFLYFDVNGKLLKDAMTL